jgi:hypothetical protein
MNSFLKLRENFMKIIKDVGKGEMSFFINLVNDMPSYNSLKEDQDASGGDNQGSDNDFQGSIGQNITIFTQLDALSNTADVIYENLSVLFKVIRIQCPRYFFLSEEQMLICCSLLKFP